MPDARSVRIQMEVSYDTANKLEALQAAGGLDTKRELLDNALTLLQWALHQADKGRAIAAIDDDARQYVELEMPCLDFVRSKRSTVHSQNPG